MNTILIDLFRSIKQNDRDAFQNLISKQSIDLTQYLYGCTPLYYSIECKNEELALELLRNANAGEHLQSNLGVSCLEKAMENKLFKVVDVLLKRYKRADLGKLDTDSETLLTKCIKLYDQKCAVMLIEAGVDVNTCNNKSNEYPIELSIKLNKLLVLDAILKSSKSNQVQVDTLPNGYKPLLEACENDYTEIAMKLIDAGANVNIEDEKYLNWTPLMYAISNSNEQLIMFLLEAKSSRSCNVNHIDENLNTPLHLASESENEFIVRKLLNAGAQKTFLNIENQTAFDIAKANEDESMMNILK